MLCRIAKKHSKIFQISMCIMYVDILVSDLKLKVPTSQQKRLAKAHKFRFISMLIDKCTAENILVRKANNDAEVLIIETAIEQF